MKAKYNIDKGYSISENDRGDWKLVSTPVYSFVGYGGENIMTIHSSYMQSLNWEIIGVYDIIDNPLVIRCIKGKGLDPYLKAMEDIVDLLQ